MKYTFDVFKFQQVFQLLIIHYSLIIKKKGCMPISRILYPDTRPGHLSFICDTDCSVPVAPNPPMCPPETNSIEPISTTGLHGLTIRKVCPPGMSPSPGCALLPHIFTLTPHRRERLFSVALSRVLFGQPRCYRGTALCIVRTFLPGSARGDRSTYSLSVKLYVYFIGQSYIA